ncbi:MAG: ParA family protein [Actinomycetaceae bacterium]|nr:ParA family protein [Actinomycetaceae bacterium]
MQESAGNDPYGAYCEDGVPILVTALDAPEYRQKLLSQTLMPPPSTRVITLANQKGGVGKTTSTVNIAAGFAQQGFTTVVIDMDSQGNASTALSVDRSTSQLSMYDVMTDGCDLGKVLQECPHVPGLFVAPSTIELAGIDIELFQHSDGMHRLYYAISEFLRHYESPDYIFIDCPPSLGLATINSLVAADEVLVPLQAEYYSLEGLQQLRFTISKMKNSLNDQLNVSGILVTMYDARNNLSKDVYAEVYRAFPELVFQHVIPRSVRAAEAPSHQQTVMTMDPASPVSVAYLGAAVEIATHGADNRRICSSFFLSDNVSAQERTS